MEDKRKMLEVFTGETITGTDIDIAIWIEDMVNLFDDEELTFVDITEIKGDIIIF